MCLLRYMSGVSLRDRNRNEGARGGTPQDGADIKDKMREHHLWWFGRVIDKMG